MKSGTKVRINVKKVQERLFGLGAFQNDLLVNDDQIYNVVGITPNEITIETNLICHLRFKYDEVEVIDDVEALFLAKNKEVDLIAIQDLINQQTDILHRIQFALEQQGQSHVNYQEMTNLQRDIDWYKKKTKGCSCVSEY